mgnify:CR=1 FL=1
MDPNTLPRTSILYIQKKIRALPILVALCLFFQWGCKNKSGLTKIDASPVVRTTAPTTNAIDVPVNSTISAVFSDDMNPSTVSGSTFILQNDTVAITGSISYADSVATFVPVNKLSYNSNYTATITSGAQSLSGTGLERNHEWSFSTLAQPLVTDTDPPKAVSTNPADNDKEVSVNTLISVTFSEPINDATINSSSFSVSHDEILIDGTVTYEENTARFAPSDPLPFGTIITATVTSSVKDTAGNALENDLSWSFTTEANPDNTAPEISATEPVDKQENVAPNTVITATFNEPMNPTSINSSTFTLRQGSIGITGSISYSGNSATFIPSGELSFGTLYTATITDAVEDLAGNNLSDDIRWRFTTGSEPDETAPVVATTDPEANEVDVPVNSNITATFSEPLDGSTVTNSTFTVRQNGTIINGTITYSGLTAIFNPSNNLSFGSNFEASITSGVQDLAGNNLSADFNWGFTTVQETIPPVIASTFPAKDAENIAVGTTISVTFSEPMDPTTINATTFNLLDDDDNQINGTITYSDNTATFTPSADLSFDKTYTGSVTTGVQDLAGNNLQNNFSWTFSTAKDPDKSVPEVTTTSPTNNQADVAIASNITVTFNEPMSTTTIDNTSFLVSQDGTPVNGEISYSGTTATFNPNNNFAFDATITATITTAATDLAGNALGSDFSWSFTTEQESTPPVISNTSPANNATNVSAGTAITATFNEAMDASTINGSGFMLNVGNTPVAGSVIYAEGSNTATFTPEGNLALGTTYTATITSDAQDLAGNAMESDFVWTFTTEQESTPPEITTVTPADGADNVTVSSNITAEFNEDMNSDTINNASFTVTQNGNPISGTVSYSGTTATFNPNNDFAFDAAITATITTVATDLAGNNLSNNVSWSFNTEQESTPPTITSTNPVNEAQNIQTNTSITANFSEPMDPGTINNTTFTLAQRGTPIAGNVTYSGTTALFTPNNNLAFASTFTATVTTGAQDVVGNALASDFSWTFATAQEITAPQVTTVSPANGSSDIAVNTNITAGFSEPMDQSSINETTFTVSQNGADVAGSINYSGTTATFNPTNNLGFGSLVTITITTGASDQAGNSMVSDFVWTFTTEQESVPPTVTSTTPTDGMSDVSVAGDITATFSEAMDPGTINGTTFSVSQNGSPVAGSINYSGTAATFNPTSNLAFGASITATITTGMTDVAGNNLASNLSWSFTTEQESVPPSVISTTPSDGATNVSTSTSITATFSEPLNPATVNGSTFSVEVGGSSISGTVSYSDNTATFTSDADLPFGSSFTVTITNGVQDPAGNPLVGNKVWTFTTEQESTPPTVTSTTPPDGTSDVSVAGDITATFSENMDPATFNGTTFSVSQNESPVAGSINYSGTTATFNPTNNLGFGSLVTVTITTGASDQAGNNMVSDFVWTFTTEQESVPPEISATSPAENATDVPVNTAITATFNEAMDETTINETTFSLSQGGTPVSGSISYEAGSNTATLTPSANLAFNSDFTATITTGVEDLAGNALTEDVVWNFTTEAPAGEETDIAPLTGSIN